MLSQELTTFIEESINAMNDQRSSLEENKESIIKFLDERFISKIPMSNISIQGRVKSEKSLREKIIRKRDRVTDWNPENYVNGLDDLIGLRIVCLLEKEEEIIFNYLSNKFFVEMDSTGHSVLELDQQRPYFRINKMNQPDKQKNGKSIYKMKCQWITEGRDYNVELQIKSLSNAFWGEVEHMLFYKNYAYTVGAGFYKDIMNSIGDLLHSVDHQLEILKEQMSVDDVEKQISEIKQMVTRLLYSQYQPEIKEMIKSDIDLREVYEMVVEIIFNKIKRKSRALEKASEIIIALNNKIVLSSEDFNLDQYKIQDSSYDQKSISQIICGLANNNDIFWKSLFVIYNIFKKDEEVTSLSDEITKNLFSLYFVYKNELIDTENPGTKLLIEGIDAALFAYFSNYKKLDFFVPNVLQKQILNYILQFVNSVQDEFSEIKQSEICQQKKQSLNEFLIFYLKLKFELLIKGEIEKTELLELENKLNKGEMLWLPTINTETLGRFISQENSVSSTMFEKLEQRAGEIFE